MRFSSIALGFATAACTAAAPVHEDTQAVLQNVLSTSQALIPSPERYLIELSPGVTRWVEEEEKWELKRKGIKFMDITNHGLLGISRAMSSNKLDVKFPDTPAHSDTIKPLLKSLDKSNMRKNLERFTSFWTRYYQSSSGTESAAWLASQVNSTLSNATKIANDIGVALFPHRWDQPSIIATIPGKSEKRIVIGAHQDSINMFLPSILPAPGADDDGSGTVTILEALRVLLTAGAINGTDGHTAFENTIEFHWYSAEEGGLLGSQDVFAAYESNNVDVKAMLQQDMTGYIQGTLDKNKEESVGVITDWVDPALTEFIKKVIKEYCDIPYVETRCGYACSDHASALKAGYPAAFVIESTFADSDHMIHTTEDTIDLLSFDHMLQHAKLTLALAYELGMHKFE